MRIFLLSCGPLKKEEVSPVDLEEKYHKIFRSLECAPLGFHDEEHEAVYHILCECLTHLFSFFPGVLILLDYLQIHRAVPCMFLFFRYIVMMMK